MRNEDLPAPKFSETLAKSFQSAAKESGFSAYIPWHLLISFSLSTLFFYYIAGNDKFEPNGIVAVLSAYTAIGGFIGSASIAAMAQIHNICSQHPFSDYLKTENLLDLFLFQPQFIIIIQIFFFISSGFSAMFVLMSPDTVDLSTIIIVCSGLLVYSSIKTWTLIDLLRILTWHLADYNSLSNSTRK